MDVLMETDTPLSQSTFTPKNCSSLWEVGKSVLLSLLKLLIVNQRSITFWSCVILCYVPASKMFHCSQVLGIRVCYYNYWVVINIHILLRLGAVIFARVSPATYSSLLLYIINELMTTDCSRIFCSIMLGVCNGAAEWSVTKTEIGLDILMEVVE